MEIIPNLFIVGAPKCGTTALSEYLRAHPEVFFSSPKEPHFFNTDFSTRHTYDTEKYLECFKNYSGQKIIAEGSVFYLYSKEAIPNILKINPEAKFIVMVRDPIEIAHAWHSQAIKNGSETVGDFEKAWSLIKKRKNGKSIPPFTRRVEQLMYSEIGKIGTQINRASPLIKNENLLILEYNTFFSSIESNYLKVLDFLKIDPNQKPENFEKINTNKSYKNLQFKNASETLIKSFKKIFKVKSNYGLYSKTIGKWNQIEQQRQPLRSEFKRQLKKYFIKEVLEVNKYVEEDLLKIWDYK